MNISTLDCIMFWGYANFSLFIFEISSHTKILVRLFCFKMGASGWVEKKGYYFFFSLWVEQDLKVLISQHASTYIKGLYYLILSFWSDDLSYILNFSLAYLLLILPDLSHQMGCHFLQALLSGIARKYMYVYTNLCIYTYLYIF